MTPATAGRTMKGKVMIHTEKHPLAGQTVKIKPDVTHPQFKDFGGSEFHIEDWQDRIVGRSWMDCDGNPACLVYAVRTSNSKYFHLDDEVVYGHRKDGFGLLVHVTELDINPSPLSPPQEI